MAISKPLYLNKNRLNSILITASVGISFVYNFPRFFEFKSRRIVDEDIQEYNDTLRGILFYYLNRTGETELTVVFLGNDTGEGNTQLWDLAATPLREVHGPDLMTFNRNSSMV